MDRLDLVRATANGDDALLAPIVCRRCAQPLNCIAESEGCEDLRCWAQEIAREAEYLAWSEDQP